MCWCDKQKVIDGQSKQIRSLENDVRFWKDLNESKNRLSSDTGMHYEKILREERDKSTDLLKLNRELAYKLSKCELFDVKEFVNEERCKCCIEKNQK